MESLECAHLRSFFGRYNVDGCFLLSSCLQGVQVAFEPNCDHINQDCEEQRHNPNCPSQARVATCKCKQDCDHDQQSGASGKELEREVLFRFSSALNGGCRRPSAAGKVVTVLSRARSQTESATAHAPRDPLLVQSLDMLGRFTVCHEPNHQPERDRRARNSRFVGWPTF